MNNENSSNLLKIGNLILCADTHSLIINEQHHRLRNKLFQLLVYLIDKRNTLVSRKELIDAIWDGNYYIGEKGLTHAVCILRTKLKEAGDSGLSIETIPKTGYLLKVKGVNSAQTKSKESDYDPTSDIDTSIPDWWPQNLSKLMTGINRD
ncbi:winged helix-turn-helix domain-containing protein [Pleionea sediminis]|uniref:winged helix-turn-helix domain-containing protein n=1 Tax=Pleionea sediminis TaxID=2569479 RepID=UPI001185B6C2|nr:winged helix-turn-helix domain-containing protein [Pleionea sediminis]